jgi:invasion protein IalB
LAQDTPERTVMTETFESWILTCVTSDQRQDCEINQNIADPSGSPLMQLQVGTFNNSGPERTMLARFPVNVTTTMPIIWSAGDLSLGLTLRACLSTFCAADGRISEDLAHALLEADPQSQTRFTLTRADGTTMSLPLSLTGFADAWTAMVDRTSH